MNRETRAWRERSSRARATSLDHEEKTSRVLLPLLLTPNEILKKRKTKFY